MLDITQVREDIENWITGFVEIPHPALGNWPPCPYARRSRLAGSFDVRLGTQPYQDLQGLAATGLQGKEVVVYAYRPGSWPYLDFHQQLERANQDFLLAKDLIVLEDHPYDLEMVNGVCLNQGTYALSMVQGLSDLNSKARVMSHKGFYKSWPEEYLANLFNHRQDPRL